MYGYSTVLIVMILTAISLLTLACRTTNLPTLVPAPTPTAIPSDRLYAYLLDEKSHNPTRLNDTVERQGIWRFSMVITKIEGRKIQQHFAQPLGEPDQYIECEFKDENQVIPLNVDQSIDVYGKLHEAFKGKRLWPNSKAVKFRDCYY